MGGAPLVGGAQRNIAESAFVCKHLGKHQSHEGGDLQ